MQVIKSVFHDKEMRRRLLFLVLIMAVYRLGASIPVPGVNTNIDRKSVV